MANVIISWSGDNTIPYTVQYKKTTSSEWIEPSASPVVGLALTLTGLDASTDYSFRVSSVCSGINWIYDTFKTPSGACDKITSLALSSVSETTINVSWTASVTAVNGYIVQYKTASSSWFSLPATTNTIAVLTGLTPGTQYYVRVISLCAGTSTATSGSQSATTSAPFNQCGSISITSASIAANTSNYTASWTNTGGTPATVLLEYSVDGGSTYTSFSTIVSQTSSSITYTLPGGLGAFPVSHKLRITPKCSDDGLGTAGVATYTAPDIPTQFVTITNNLSSGSISSISINSSPNVLLTPIGSGSSLNYNQTGLLGNSNVFNALLSGVTNGSFIKIEIVRSASVIATYYVVYNGSPIQLYNGMTLDQDIIRIAYAPINFTASSTLGGVSITSTNPSVSSIRTGSYPITAGTSVTGYQLGISLAITVNLSGSAISAGNIALRKNGSLVGCVNVPLGGSGSFTLPFTIFQASDACDIALNIGSC